MPDYIDSMGAHELRCELRYQLNLRQADQRYVEELKNQLVDALNDLAEMTEERDRAVREYSNLSARASSAGTFVENEALRRDLADVRAENNRLTMTTFGAAYVDRILVDRNRAQEELAAMTSTALHFQKERDDALDNGAHWLKRSYRAEQKLDHIVELMVFGEPRATPISEKNPPENGDPGV